MKTNAVRFAAGLALIAFGAPFPACGQFAYPALIVVPPPVQVYGTPKPAPTPRPPKLKPEPDLPPQAKLTGHYEGRIYVLD